MKRPASSIPFDLGYLKSASSESLSAYELHKLNAAANLQRQIKELFTELLHETTAAALARTLLHSRQPRRRMIPARAGRRKSLQTSSKQED